MSYWDWKGNKNGKSIFDTMLPVYGIFAFMIIMILILWFTGD